MPESIDALQSDSSVVVSREEFSDLTRSMIGLPVSLARQGLDGALILDLGRLTPTSGPRRYLCGEVSLVLEWDWRFEWKSEIVFGASSSEAYVYAQLSTLSGQSVVGVRVQGEVPELVVDFSQGLRARSFASAEGDARWNLGLADGSCLYCERGALHHEPCGAGDAVRLSQEEASEMARAAAAADRWGERLSATSNGCKDCAHLVRLDGFAKFRDYGVCSSPRSLLDGRVVSLRSGCAAFTEK